MASPKSGKGKGKGKDASSLEDNVEPEGKANALEICALTVGAFAKRQGQRRKEQKQTQTRWLKRKLRVMGYDAGGVKRVITEARRTCTRSW